MQAAAVCASLTAGQAERYGSLLQALRMFLQDGQLLLRILLHLIVLRG